MPSGPPDSTTSDCFLCAYDPHAPCDLRAVEGVLAELVLGGRGQPPALTLETATGKRFRIALQDRDAKLLRDLKALPQEVRQSLRLRVFHLRQLTTALDSGT